MEKRQTNRHVSGIHFFVHLIYFAGGPEFIPSIHKYSAELQKEQLKCQVMMVEYYQIPLVTGEKEEGSAALASLCFSQMCNWCKLLIFLFRCILSSKHFY